MSQRSRRPPSRAPQAPDADPGSGFFRTWATVVLRLRWPLLLASALGTAWMAMQLPKLVLDNSVEVFMDSESGEARVMRELRDSFGHDALIFALVEGDVFSLDYLERLGALHADLAAIDIPVDSLGSRFQDRAAHREQLRGGGAGEAGASTEATDLATATDPFDYGDGLTGDEGWGDEAGGSLVEKVTSLVNARWTEREGDALRVRGLLETWPTEASLPALRETALSDPALLGRLVSKDGGHSVLLVQTGFMAEPDRARVFREVQRIAARHEAAGFHVMPAGLPAINASLNDMMMADAQRLLAAALLATILMLWAIFRHPLGIVGPVLVVVQALVWTFGAIAFTGVPVTVIMNILPAFLITVGVADAVHIQSVYREQRRLGVANRAAIADAIATTAKPVLYTTATTCVGLLSFRMATLDAIGDTGTFGALGVGIALLHSLVSLPLLLSFNHRSLLGAKPPRAGVSLIDRFLGVCNDSSRPVGGSYLRTRLSLVAVGLLVLAAAHGSSQLTVHQDFLEWFPSDHPTKLAFDALDREMGGAADISLMIEPTGDRDMRDRELLLAMERLEAHILAFRDPKTGERWVGNIVSVLDPVRESWRMLGPAGGERTAAAALPDTQQGVTDMFTVFESSASQHLRELATLDMGRSVMTIRVKWMDAFSYAPITKHIEVGIQRHLDGLAVVKPTGSALNTFRISSAVTTDMLRSFGLAFVVVTIMMVLMLADLKLGLIAMVPNILPIAAVMACMGWLGIPIDIGTLLVASIAMGLAVDDTIHFMHQFRASYAAQGDVERAIDHAFSHSGRALAATSAILLAGDLILLLAVVIMLQRFGFLCGLTVVFALLADLLFAPALLRTFYRSRPAQPPLYSPQPPQSPQPPSELQPGGDRRRADAGVRAA